MQRYLLDEWLPACAARIRPTTVESYRHLIELHVVPATVGALRAHRARQAADRLALGAAYNDHDLVVARLDGTPVHPNNVGQHFRRQIVKAGLPLIRFHDLRHTHATLALQAGIHPKIVSERLGHASTSFTLDVYSHATPSMQQHTADVMSALLSG